MWTDQKLRFALGGLFLFAGCETPVQQEPERTYVSTAAEIEQQRQYKLEQERKQSEVESIAAYDELLRQMKTYNTETPEQWLLLDMSVFLRTEKEADFCTARRIWYAEKHTEISEQIRQAILSGMPVVGMTHQQTIACIGAPFKVNRTVVLNNVSEQWIYKGSLSYCTPWCVPGSGNWELQYVYFENGKLIGWQN